MKKFVSLIVAAALLGTAAGCKKKEEVKEEGGAITLKVLMPAEQQKDLNLVMDEVNKITEEKIGAKIDMVFIDSGAYTEKMNMKLATKEYFDVCFTSSWLNPYDKGVNNNAYYPLTKLIDEYAPKLKDEMPDYWWEAVKRNDEIYAVPNQQVASTTIAFTMNKNWADKYNVDIDSIKTANDIEPFLETVKQNEPDYFPMRPYGNYWVKNYEAITSVVGLDKRESGKLKAIYNWDAEGYTYGLQKLREWFEKGYFRSDVGSVLDDSSDFYGNKYIVTGTGWKPGFEATQSAVLGGEHVTMKIGNPIVTGDSLIGTMYSVSAYSNYPEKAIEYIELVNTDKDLYNLLCYGVEGKHYDWVDDNHIKMNENGGYYVNSSWEFGNQFNAYLLEGQEDNIWEETKAFNDSAEKSKLLGFVVDTSNIQTEITQISTVQSEYKNMLNNGSLDWKENFEEYKKKMMAAGAENVLNEVQRQLDEFAKSTNN